MPKPAKCKYVAKVTLDKLENYASENGFQKMSLPVFPSSPRAQEIYEKAGFQASQVPMIKVL